MTLFEFDNEIREDYNIFCGVDEAGSGPLAGDVFAAAVIFNKDTFIDGINDSKKLSEKKREVLFNEIIEKADDYCIASANVDEIEEYNILKATFIAMNRAVLGLKKEPFLALVDGNREPLLTVNVKTLIKGDGISASIAAASILAKVSRDRYMAEMAENYPEYQFDKHKGYGTKVHCELIKKYGPCEIHRQSFLKKILKNG